MPISIHIGDFVRRKKDKTGRARRIGHIQTDADGKRAVTLDDYLDGWLIWDADELIAVPQETLHEQAKQKTARSANRQHQKHLAPNRR